MLIGLLTIDLHILEADSLKSKRLVIRSLKDRIKNKFNVSVAEVDGADLWQRSVIAVACVSNETRVINQSFQGIREMVLGMPSVELLSSRAQML